jgi:hypothetical protein
MAQIQYPENPVKVECDDRVENVTIWFERNNRIGISNHEERDVTGKSEYMLVGNDSARYRVIEPYEFPENATLTLTGMYICSIL